MDSVKIGEWGGLGEGGQHGKPKMLGCVEMDPSHDNVTNVNKWAGGEQFRQADERP